MPMSKAFERRLYRHIPEIIARFGSPFLIYDEVGILETGQRLKRLFRSCPGFREFFAVKALPNPEILKIMKGLGFGFDCSSIMELQLADRVGARSDDIMFTSNNTSKKEFEEALKRNVILNLDDISMIKTLRDNWTFPSRICFRYNPGKSRKGNSIIGRPEEAKYGITDNQLISAYSAAQNAGAIEYDIHSMICSNQRDYRYMVATVKMLLDCCWRLEQELGIRCKSMNMGGGLGVNYKPNQKPLDLEKMAAGITDLFRKFKSDHNWLPDLYMESGRYITGPHGALVTKVINRKDTYQTHIGVDACPMASIPRPMIYDAFHQLTVLNSFGEPKLGRREKVNVVGPACENTDRFATQRMLPKADVGDLVVVHEAGAHALAMAFNYNGRLRPQELLLRTNGTVSRIRRAETNEDLWRTIDGAGHADLNLKPS